MLPSPPSISILVCYHKFFQPVIAGDFLSPIIVGAQNLGAKAQSLQENLESSLPKPHQKERAQQGGTKEKEGKRAGGLRAEGAEGAGGENGSGENGNRENRENRESGGARILRDDVGENISALNENFCELTAMYWAWKNVDSHYYGLFHYRRVLDLSEEGLRAPPHTKPITTTTKKFSLERLGLSRENLARLIPSYDLILPHAYIDHKDEVDYTQMSLYDLYGYHHHARDLDICIELIRARYPKMQAALESTLFTTKPPSWHIANMFVMRKELYYEYCEWIFSLLFSLRERIDISGYNSYQARVFGFLSERLFNVWVAYKRQEGGLRILEAPLIYLEHSKPLIGWDNNPRFKRFYFLGLRLYKTPIH